MAILFRLPGRLRRDRLPLAVLLLGLAVTTGLGLYEQQATDTKQDEQLLNELSRVSAQIEQAFHQRLSVITGLEAFVHSQQDLDLRLPDQEKLFFYRFNRFTSAMEKQVPGILSMQLAPGAVLQYMSNQAEHAGALGHDLLVDDNRRTQVLQTITARSLIVAGPLTLIQGGEAIVARKAIYTRPRTFQPKDFIEAGRASHDTEWLQQIPTDFWGLATVLIDIDELYSAAGLNALPDQVSYALRGRHGLGHEGDIFWGDKTVFDQNSVEITVALPAGEWVLAARDTRPVLGWSTLLVLIIGALVSVFIAYSIRQSLEKRHFLAVSRAKTDFLATMSHELRTPLNAILGFSQLLQHDAELNEDQRDSVEEISRAGHHLLALVNDVLDLVKIESGHLDLLIQDVQVAPIIADCCSLLAPAAQSNQIQLNNDCQGPWSVQADSTRFKQAFLNLLSNAIKYNNRGGRVDIHCHTTSEGFLRISLSDTGSGISTERMQQLFQPFNRLDMKNSHIEGTGIGLAIVKSLITNMNGRVGATSTPNVGSCFWLELPLVSVSSETNTDDASQAPAPKF
ncbi:hypothetical protein CFI10_06305 [Marinobacterium iners]|uniref:ATP-binding protein n=1 Tax=Marinobacterium iners TaxID=48076 RepID=UPI001A8E37D2|nr:ATP-binding protein [Marinobacterium iners]QSR34605.1 hypothetical protein CFI10_06305 [Marinobacterium iners]